MSPPAQSLYFCLVYVISQTAVSGAEGPFYYPCFLQTLVKLGKGYSFFNREFLACTIYFVVHYSQPTGAQYGLGHTFYVPPKPKPGLSEEVRGIFASHQPQILSQCCQLMFCQAVW